MTEKRKKSILASLVAVSMLLIGAFSMYLVMPSDDNGGFGTLSVSAAEANPGAGAGGILEIFIIDHANRPANYATNISEGDSFVLGCGNATSFSINIPHDKAFDIVVKCRANATQAYNNTGSEWETDWIKCILNATGAITINENMNETEIANNSNYIWVNYWIDNSGSGYTIDRDETVTISKIDFQYYG